jgi:hypothetical protein
VRDIRIAYDAGIGSAQTLVRPISEQIAQPVTQRAVGAANAAAQSHHADKENTRTNWRKRDVFPCRRCKRHPDAPDSAR